VEVDGDDTYFTQEGHGSYLGICTDSSEACGSDTGLASVNGYSSKADATKFTVEEGVGQLAVYLKAKLSDKYLSFACPVASGPLSASGAAHNIFGYPDAGTFLLQGKKQAAPPARAKFSVEFISRTTTTTTPAPTAAPTVAPSAATPATPAPTAAPDSASTDSDAAPAAGVDGASASLDAAGFKAVTAMCCPPEMETFFGRLLAKMGLDVCSKAHIQGLMHWFSCVPDMDFQYLIDVINNGNPCKYWTATGTTCPALSPECQGEWCR